MGKILTTNMVIEQFRAKHGDLYLYPRFEYKSMKENSTMTCRIHGDFTQTPENHKQGKGCQKCAKIKRQEKRKLGLEEFIKRARLVHGDFYGYEDFIYKNSWTPGDIFCPIHGFFPQKPAVHVLMKCGCPDCGIELGRIVRTRSVEEFVHEANIVHNFFYIYDLVKEIINGVKLDIICPIHGIFPQSCKKHLSGQGCKKCGNISKGEKTKLTVEEFVCRANIKHCFKYEYSLFIYVNSHTNGDIICPIHGIFPQTPKDHLRGNGCPKCGRESKIEKQSGSNSYNWNPDRESVELNREIRVRSSNLVKKCLKLQGKFKVSKTEEYLGYSRIQLRERLENHPNWTKVKDQKWHMDHIFPLTAFTEYGITDLKIINALDNLQPLSQFENLSKGDKYDKIEFENWLKSKNAIFGSKIS